jgi:hypothetical protein
MSARMHATLFVLVVGAVALTVTAAHAERVLVDDNARPGGAETPTESVEWQPSPVADGVGLDSPTDAGTVHVTPVATIDNPGNSYQVTMSPDGGYVLVGDEYQSYITFATSTGDVLWTYTLPDDIEMEGGAIAADGELVVVGGQGGSVFALSRDGALLWRAQEPTGEVSVAMTAAADKVFAESFGDLYCYDGEGNLLWQNPVDTRGWWIWGLSTTLTGDRLLIRTNSDIILCGGLGNETGFFNVVDGNHLVAGDLSPHGDQFAVLFSEDDIRYVALYSVTTGELWRREVDGLGKVQMDRRGNVFATTRDARNYLWNNFGVPLITWPDGGYGIDTDAVGRYCIVGRFSEATVYEIGGISPPPTVVIVDPANDLTVPYETSEQTFAGTASDEDGTVLAVDYRIRGGDWSAADGTTTSWSFTAGLEVGPNLVEVRAQDDSGVYSEIASRTITRAPHAEILTIRTIAVASPSDCAAVTIPGHVGTVWIGDTFYVELWAQVTNPPLNSNGLNCVFADVGFDEGVVSASSVESCPNFGTSSNGTIQPGLIDELGGCNLTSGLGIGPAWALIGRAKMTADAQGQTDLSPVCSDTGCSILGYGAVPCDQIVWQSDSVTVPPAVPADFDRDGDVDLFDYGVFSLCFSGPGNPPALAFCDALDFDDDGDVDLSDYGTFLGCYNGPGRRPACLPLMCPAPAQDADRDGDVDLADYGALLSCYNGPGNAYGDAEACPCLDVDDDDDVDLSDYAAFLNCYNGPNKPPACE